MISSGVTDCVLLLPGIELIFLIELTWGCVLDSCWKVLIAQGCFSYGWAELTLSGPFLLLNPSSKGAGGTGIWERTQLTPSDLRVSQFPSPFPIFHSMFPIPSSHYQFSSLFPSPFLSHPQWGHAQLGEKQQGAHSEGWFVSPSHPQGWWIPAFLGIAAHLPGHGKWGMNSMLCFALCAIIFPAKVSLSQPTCFLPVTFLVLSSVPLGSSEQQICEAELLAGVEPWHHEKVILSWNTAWAFSSVKGARSIYNYLTRSWESCLRTPCKGPLTS